MAPRPASRPVGILCPVAPESPRPGDFASVAERLGFESVWVGEHPAVPRDLQHPYVQLEDGEVPFFYTNLPDPWMTLAHIAGATNTIRLGTAVGIVPLRHPLHLAKMLATLDRQSGGRLIVGAGAGWLREEMALFDVEFESRFDRLVEMVEAMRQVWAEETPSFAGEHVHFPPILSRYPPIQQPIPILCGIHGPKGRQHAARWADGWLPVSSGPENLERDLALLKDECERTNRDFTSLDITVMAGLDDESPDDAVQVLFEAGATRVLLAIGTVTTARTVKEAAQTEHPLAPTHFESTLERFAARYLAR